MYDGGEGAGEGKRIELKCKISVHSFPWQGGIQCEIITRDVGQSDRLQLGGVYYSVGQPEGH